MRRPHHLDHRERRLRQGFSDRHSMGLPANAGLLIPQWTGKGGCFGQADCVYKGGSRLEQVSPPATSLTVAMLVPSGLGLDVHGNGTSRLLRNAQFPHLCCIRGGSSAFPSDNTKPRSKVHQGSKGNPKPSQRTRAQVAKEPPVTPDSNPESRDLREIFGLRAEQQGDCLSSTKVDLALFASDALHNACVPDSDTMLLYFQCPGFAEEVERPGHGHALGSDHGS